MMEFRVEEKGELLHLHPMNTDAWMIVRGHGDTPWKLYKSTDDGHTYITDFLKLKDATDAAQAL